MKKSTVDSRSSASPAMSNNQLSRAFDSESSVFSFNLEDKSALVARVLARQLGKDSESYRESLEYLEEFEERNEQA